MMNFKDQKYRKSLIDIILKAKEFVNCNKLRNLVLNLFEQLRKENNRSQFMKYLMLDLYNDDEHGDIERAFRKENFKKWGKNYLFSMLRFHILEHCGNFRDMSLQLYGNENFVTFRKIGNKIFMNLPMPQASDESNNCPLNHFKGRGNRGYRGKRRCMIKPKNIGSSSPSDDDDESSSDNDREMEKNLKRKRIETMRRIHQRKKINLSELND